MEGLICQFSEGHPKDTLTFQNEAFKSGTVLRRDTGDLSTRDVKISGTAHHFAIIKADQIEGIHRAQINILRKLTASE